MHARLKPMFFRQQLHPWHVCMMYMTVQKGPQATAHARHAACFDGESNAALPRMNIATNLAGKGL